MSSENEYDECEYEEETPLGQMPRPDYTSPDMVMPAMGAYDSDQLNYLRYITEDDYYRRLLAFVDSSKFTDATKDSLRLLIYTYNEPADFALTSIRSDRELRRFYNDYRMARKRFKCGIQLRDDTNMLAQILDHIEGHLKLRLSRSKGGFERMEQSSVRQHIMQTGEYTQTQEVRPRQDTVSQIFSRKQ